MSSEGRAALLDPRFLAALVVLVVNDHWAKSAHPGWLTGKLSDVAGMVVLPVVAALLLPLGFPAHRRHAAALVGSALVLVAIKCSTAGAAWVVWALETTTGVDHRIVADPTDLIGLSGLLIARAVLRRPTPLDLSRCRHIALHLVRAAALFACVATSYEPDSGWDRLDVDDGEVVAWSTESWREPIRSEDNGRTWSALSGGADTADDPTAVLDRGIVCLRDDARRCVRLDVDESGRFTIEERDGDEDEWTTVWSEDGRSRWVRRQFGHDAEIAPRDVAVLDDDTVLVAAGRIEPLRRDPTSGRWTPSPGDIREFPFLVGVGAALMTMAGIGTVRRARGRSDVAVVWGLVFASLAFGTLNLVAGSILGMVGAVIVAVTSCVLVVIRRMEIADAKRRGTHRAQSSLALLASVGAAAATVPLAIFADGRVSWHAGVIGTAIAVVAISGLAGSLGPARSVGFGLGPDRQPPPPQGPPIIPADQPPPPAPLPPPPPVAPA